MNDPRSLERMVVTWMADEAAGLGGDALFEEMLAVTVRARPEPRWLALLREPPMRLRAREAVGSTTRRLALIAALVALLLVAAIAAGTVLLRPRLADNGWPGFRGDASRSGIAVEGPIGNPVLDWRFEASAAIRGSVAIVGDLVIASSDDGRVYALAVDSGLERWSIRVPVPPANAPLAIGDRIYVADGAGSIHALGLDGRPVWTSSSQLAGPTDLTIGGDRIYGGSADGSVGAFATTDGHEIWRTMVSSTRAAVHAPSFGDDIVVAVADSGEFVGLDARTGEIRWAAEVGADTGTPVVAAGVAYVGSGVTTAVATRGYDLKTGALKVTIDAGSYSPIVIDGVGYAGSPLGVVSARDLGTGVERWRTTFAGIVRPPAIAGDIVYVTADVEHRVFALDRVTGGELWSMSFEGSNNCCLAVARGKVVVATGLGYVYAIGGDGATLRPSPRIDVRSPSLPAPTLRSDPPSATPNLVNAQVLWTATGPDDGFIPWGLSRDGQGRLWAAEPLRDRFAIFDEEGTFLEYWGTSGSGKGEFDLTRENGDPFGAVAFAPDGSFYVLDVGNHRVQQFAGDRTFVGAWGRFGRGPGMYVDPLSIVVGPDGRVHVLDNERRVIETYGPDGEILRTIDAYPATAGPTEGANQLTIDAAGHFYLGLLSPSKVIELDAEGRLVRTFGVPDSGPSPFNEQPNVMAFDQMGRLYVTQGPQRRDRPGVVVFARDGRYLGGFGALGGDDGELGFPWGLVIDASGDLFICDAGEAAGDMPGVELKARVQRIRVTGLGE